MANALQDHVWIIDTASATPVSLEEQRVKVIRFVPAAITDTVTLAKGDGDVVWEAVAGGSTVPQESTLSLRLTGGFVVATLTAGAKLYLYLSLDDKGQM